MTDPMVSGSCASYAMATLILTAALLSLAAVLAALYRRVRLGTALLRECSGDYALCWAELRELREKNREDTARLKRAMRLEAARHALLGDEP